MNDLDAVGGHATGVIVSTGVATRSVDDTTFQDLLKRADRALYRAKAEGRNRVADSAAPRDDGGPAG